MAAGPLISIVDDDESMRISLVALVRSFGFDAHGFSSAEEFLGSTRFSSFACIITDFQMPGMSGIELKKHLSAHHSALPVIMITARTDPGLEQKARASGVVCFLRKPFETQTLVRCIERALRA